MRLISDRFVMVCAAGLLAGCGTTASLEKSEAEADTAIKSAIPEVAESWGTAANTTEILQGWVSSFGDAELVQLVQEAQENNKNLAASAAGVARSWALARQAGAALTPDIGLAAGAARTGSPGTSGQGSNSITTSLQVSWEADVWGRVRSGAAAATASAQSAEADYLFAQHSLAAATARAYFSSIEARLQTRITEENVRALEETLRIVNVRYDNGMASSQEQALAKSDLASARERLAAVEGSFRDAVRALEVLLGRYPDATLELRESLPAVPPPPPAGLPSELLERRPDMVSAERRVAAAFNAVDQAQAARLPTISLSGQLGGSSSALGDLVDPANVAWRLGTSLLAPIYDGGARREQVEIATAEQRQALAAYGQAALDAFSEIEGALDQGVVVARREAELSEAVRQSETALRLTSLRYDEGESELLDVLAVQQRVNGAKSNLSSVQRLQLEQRVNLHLALGGSWN